jgi:hypothetical protein
MRHHADLAASWPEGALIASHTNHDTTNLSFNKCHPCSWFILLPIFPVARLSESRLTAAAV